MTRSVYPQEKPATLWVPLFNETAVGLCMQRRQGVVMAISKVTWPGGLLHSGTELC